MSQTETTTRSRARCSPSAVAASARPCNTSSTASRRSALDHQATDTAVAGASQIRVRTGTRRLTRSAIVCAASRLSGTSSTRSKALCGPLGQTAGGQCGDRQPDHPERAADRLAGVRLVNQGQPDRPHGAEEAQGERHRGQLDQAAPAGSGRDRAATARGGPAGPRSPPSRASGPSGRTRARPRPSRSPGPAGR